MLQKWNSRFGCSTAIGPRGALNLTGGLLVVLALGGCGAPPASEEGPDSDDMVEPLSVQTGTYPLQYFALRIGGARVDARFPAPAGVDPAVWQPAPEVILSYQDADLILLNGAEYEGWTVTTTLPAARTVDTSAAFADQIIILEDGLTHSHGPEGEHSHDETASVTWLDLDLAERQASAVRDALARLRPEYAPEFGAAFEELAAELRSLDARLQAVADLASGRTLLAAGPGYEYLARRYGLAIESARFDAADPGSHDFWHEVEHALGHGAHRMMLIPTEAEGPLGDRLAAMEIEGIRFDILGSAPAVGDFLSAFQQNIDRLEASLSH